jgi:hypothetical protein
MRNRTSRCGISNYLAELWSVATIRGKPDGSLAIVTDPQPAADPMARVEAAAARLGDPERSDAVPLTELAERLTALHEQLQNALGELDRT